MPPPPNLECTERCGYSNKMLLPNAGVGADDFSLCCPLPLSPILFLMLPKPQEQHSGDISSLKLEEKSRKPSKEKYGDDYRHASHTIVGNLYSWPFKITKVLL